MRMPNEWQAGLPQVSPGFRPCRPARERVRSARSRFSAGSLDHLLSLRDSQVVGLGSGRNLKLGRRLESVKFQFRLDPSSTKKERRDIEKLRGYDALVPNHREPRGENRSAIQCPRLELYTLKIARQSREIAGFGRREDFSE
jgi:hypothetical protein